LLLDPDTGEELSVGVVRYPRGVIDRELPDGGGKLGPDWALQDPDDWVTVLEEAIAYVVAEGGVAPSQVAGLGVDFTSCTVLPVDADGTPLCKFPRWRRRPHAWPKLWKHHAAQPVADRLNEVALERDESFKSR
jgi:L-ribulokinase